MLGWAAYLACSWTWCIGMFLPVLLVRDYGIWGFVVFAVPNVIGAGAMGWVLREGAADRIVEKHVRAAVAFGCVTALFQAYFAFYLVKIVSDAYSPTPASVGGVPWWDSIVTVAFLTGIGWLARRKSGEQWIASLLWIVSAGIGTYLTWSGQLDFVTVFVPGPHASPIGLVALAPVCVFGFALSPYLDLTFLRAAAGQTRGAARSSFTIGFGVMFLAMILFTLGYSTLFAPIANGIVNSVVAPRVVSLVFVHMILQLIFTSWLHVKQVISKIGITGVRPKLLVLVGVVFLGLYVWSSSYHWLTPHAGLLAGEIIYRCFMSFYGLVFPAYVWLCMIPTADGHSGIEGARGRRKLVVLGAACALAAPCYWMGFIERVEWWLAPGLGMVLLARLLVRAGKPSTRPG